MTGAYAAYLGTNSRALRWPCDMPKLKVYRTPIGFHDAYVAAPSMKAALRAWGTEKNLFSRGAAELVTDPKLTKEPLASPGEVIKRPRGSAAEHRKAAGSGKEAAGQDGAAPERKPVRRKPRPDRRALEKAEQALSAARQRHERARADIDRRLDALQAKRRELVKTQENEIADLEKEREARETAYRRALDTWEA
ncbi:hypothetical protein [Sphingomonas asaccharolytica]|uniref:hypothetical protein n=1 Tax=Sphingomonas asaccharolytica TaxID=40681 RepID=UPI000A5BD70B|nr:hypothetical protein [Sphingomonas asaccharolytica]